MATKKNSEECYKYRLHYYLRKLPVEDYEVAMKFLPMFCKCSSQTLKRWIYTPVNSEMSIPADALVRIASFLQIEASELYEKPDFSQKEVRQAFVDFAKNQK